MFVFYKIVSVLNMRLDTLRNDIITYNRARARANRRNPLSGRISLTLTIVE